MIQSSQEVQLQVSSAMGGDHSNVPTVTGTVTGVPNPEQAQHAAAALQATSAMSVPSMAVPTSEWVIERRGLAHLPPWNQLPRTIRPKAKLPGFLRAGWDILELIRARGLQEFAWMVQDNHIVPSAGSAHTYIYAHEHGRTGRKRPLMLGGITITTEGGGHFWTENGQSGSAAPGTEGVFACSARDAHGEMLLGKCFRRARLLRQVSDRSVKKIDVEYVDNYSLLHLGVRELTEQRALEHRSAVGSGESRPLGERIVVGGGPTVGLDPGNNNGGR